MRYVFVGAGAVGSAIGGLLASAGKDVLLVARGEHARALAGRGLTLRCPDASPTLHVPSASGPEEARLTTDDVLVLTTKTQQAQEAVAQWADAPVRDADGAVVGRAGDLLPILTALNGVTGEEIALRYFARVLGVCVWFPAVMIEPGEVWVRGYPLRGIFHAGRYGAAQHPAADRRLLDALAADWGAAELRVLQPADVMRWKYRKLLSNLGNVLQALLGEAAEEADDVRRAAEAEGREVLAAAGIDVPDRDEVREAWSDYSAEPVPGEPAMLGGSTWQSLVRGSGSIETDYLNGEVALLARRSGRAAPVNAALAALGRRAAREGLTPGATSVAELRAAVGPEPGPSRPPAAD
ncbi:ketopantoate reductase family protein [Cellulomonas sp. PhB143]|uniref:ketopantoate reductase family protein n=1 Tax=Cellulomonas sp. PhB143 TaxID=2485186 RepID=UPI000F4678C4|nr:2-dehydropantoate 2-reductase N-terminal domain-containing protein [Cellulomonas sp. PhB143]ROS75603.1 2-dehydropantoate 2-reductase [Cellulomonas sp. PhB143]